MVNPFDIMGVDVSFDLDESALQQRLISLSGEHHPDRFTDPLDQADAADRLSQINEAHEILADPAARAEALLELRGGVEAGDEKALPPELLMEVMEVREEMEEAVASNDGETLARLRGWAEQQKAERLEKIAGLFSSEGWDAKAVRVQLNALRYASRMLEQMPG